MVFRRTGLALAAISALAATSLISYTAGRFEDDAATIFAQATPKVEITKVEYDALKKKEADYDAKVTEAAKLSDDIENKTTGYKAQVSTLVRQNTALTQRAETSEANAQSLESRISGTGGLDEQLQTANDQLGVASGKVAELTKLIEDPTTGYIATVTRLESDVAGKQSEIDTLVAQIKTPETGYEARIGKVEAQRDKAREEAGALRTSIHGKDGYEARLKSATETSSQLEEKNRKLENEINGPNGYGARLTERTTERDSAQREVRELKVRINHPKKGLNAKIKSLEGTVEEQDGQITRLRTSRDKWRADYKQRDQEYGELSESHEGTVMDLAEQRRRADGLDRKVKQFESTFNLRDGIFAVNTDSLEAATRVVIPYNTNGRRLYTNREGLVDTGKGFGVTLVELDPAYFKGVKKGGKVDWETVLRKDLHLDASTKDLPIARLSYGMRFAAKVTHDFFEGTLAAAEADDGNPGYHLDEFMANFANPTLVDRYGRDHGLSDYGVLREEGERALELNQGTMRAMVQGVGSRRKVFFVEAKAYDAPDVNMDRNDGAGSGVTPSGRPFYKTSKKRAAPNVPYGAGK